jgi:hypothetical protein
VTPSGVDDGDMSPTRLVDDETMDALVEGEPVDPRFEPLRPLADGLRALGDESLAPPSPELAAAFAGRGRDGDELAARRWRSARSTRVAAVRVGAGAAVAAVALVVAGVAGALPGPVETPVRRVVEAVTPFEVDDPGSGGVPAGNPRPAAGRPGARVSDDATGRSDGERGVDGDVVSDEAPGAANRPDDPAGADDPGEDGQGSTAGGSAPPPADDEVDEVDEPDDGGDHDDDGGDHAGDGDEATRSTTPSVTAPGSTAPRATPPRR